jgi:hypothetical protein
MIVQDRPGQDWGLGFLHQGAYSGEEMLSILIVLEDPSPFQAPNHDMVKRSGGIESGLSGHDLPFSTRERAWQDDCLMELNNVPLMCDV